MHTRKPRVPAAVIAPFGLRMQPDLKERIERAAVESGLSMNALIIAALEEKFPPEPTLEEAIAMVEDAMTDHEKAMSDETQARLNAALARLSLTLMHEKKAQKEKP